jgi:hypothetical protein
MVDLSESLKEELATLRDRLARVERGELWGARSFEPYTPAEKAAEIARIKARIAEIEASEDRPPLGASQALDQTSDMVRAAHQEGERKSFGIASGSISENPPLPPLSGAGGLTANASQVKAVEQADQAKLEAVGMVASVRINRIAIVLSVASLVVLIDEKLGRLRDERPNDRDAQAVRDEAIARYESIKQNLEALRNATVGLDERESASNENAENAAKSFGQCVRDWWNERHIEICSKAFDAGLFTLCVSVCSLVGSGGPLTVGVSGALIGGKPVIEALKAMAKSRRRRVGK